MKFFKDFSITSLSTILITFLAFINNIIITRQLGVEGRGRYAVISNLVILIALLFGEGIRKSNTILAGKDQYIVKRLFFKTIFYLILVIILLTIGYNIDLIWQKLLPNITQKLILLTLSISFFTIFWQSLQAIFLGLGKIWEYNLLQFIVPFLVLLINVFGISLFDFGIFEILIGFLVSASISSLMGIILLINKMHPTNGKNFGLRSSGIILKSSISVIEFFMLLRGDIFLINILLGPEKAGIYSVAVLFSELLQKIPSVAGPLLTSRSLQLSSEESMNITTKLFRMISLFNLVAVIILAIMGKYFIILLFGSEFNYSYEVLIYLLPAILFFGPGTILYSYYISKSYPLKIILINALVAIINIGLNVLLLKIYGVIAAAFISSITYFVWTYLLLNNFKRNSGLTFSNIIIPKRSDFEYILKSIKFRS